MASISVGQDLSGVTVTLNQLLPTTEMPTPDVNGSVGNGEGYFEVSLYGDNMDDWVSCGGILKSNLYTIAYGGEYIGAGGHTPTTWAVFGTDSVGDAVITTEITNTVGFSFTLPSDFGAVTQIPANTQYLDRLTFDVSDPVNNLPDFLAEIADTIRAKKGTTGQINAQDFPSEIASIETGVDTSNATAVAGDILLGETAYARGEKLTGTIPTWNGAYEAITWPPAYTVTNTLTYCTSNNSATTATQGTSYTATITASDGYTLDGATVSVTMGGTDITATAYADGVITIASVTGDIVVTATAVVFRSFATDTWAQISAACQDGSYKTVYQVGDTKDIELSTGETITVAIMGFDHDDLSDGSGKAPITVAMENLLATKYQMNSTSTNVGSWNECLMRTSTMATLLSQLPSDLQSVIKQVNKKTTAGRRSTSITTSSDKLWLFSQVEVDDTTKTGGADEGEQYEYWKTIKDGTVAADRVKYLSNGSGSVSDWWLRSPTVSAIESFWYVGVSGYVNGTNATAKKAVCFGFCVG